MLVVFLVAISRRAVYFLPASPALSLLAAWGWLTADDGARRRWWGGRSACLVGGGVVLGLGLPALRFERRGRSLTAVMAEHRARGLPLTTFASAAASQRVDEVRFRNAGYVLATTRR